MSSKKKLVISLSVAAAVLVAAIIAIVAVFAAAQQTVASDVKVTFRAKNVDCAVSATWETNTQTTATNFANFTIKAADGTQVYQYDVPDINLQQGESGDVYLLLTYTFTNTSARTMNVKLAAINEDTNFDVVYSDDELTTTGVDIAGKTGETASNDIFTVKIVMTEEALKSASDIVMQPIALTWTLTAIDFAE